MISRFIEKLCDNYTQIENYELAIADDTQVWHCHHKAETEEGLTSEELKSLNRYWHVQPEELIFLTEFEHHSLHNKGKVVSNETRKKLSISKIGTHYKHKDNSNYKGMWNNHGGYKLSETARKNISRAKIGNPSNTGKKWFNNGIINKVAFECPEGFVPGRLSV